MLHMKIKHIFKLLLMVASFTLLLHVSYRSTIAPLLASGQDGARGISTFRNFFSSWNMGCTKQVYVRPPPWSDSLPTIYAITPTYKRSVQKADLTRMSHTLLHVANLHWIVVEDSETKTSLVSRLLNKTGLNYTHFNVHITEKLNSRGSGQRNLALKWLRDTFRLNDSNAGVVYFADDDNTYSLELFDEMRNTKKVSVWPVAFVGGLRLESCKVNALGKVSGWDAKFAPTRPFAIDMAGFAVSLQLILSKPDVYFRLHGIPSGHQETRFLEDLVTLSDLEPKAANCTEVLVWHTRTTSPSIDGKYGDPNIET
ncbi:galactosylgalactosylxylosylprotein 3-beta-glucuronosyltransferase 1-like [Salarias fasciatus]|nr:galactosylgalactosylxylosylprotein 3-beta-glucuronosyltransferase 1-like [Salarias fasciatus]